MNLDKIGSPEGPQYLAPPEWSMSVQREGNQSVGIVMLKLQPLCRLSITSPDEGDDAARTLLANKARHWIHEYLNSEPDVDRFAATRSSNDARLDYVSTFAKRATCPDDNAA